MLRAGVVFIVFFNSLLYAQDKEPVDSISFYNKTAQTNILINNYKNAIDYTQKAINYSEANSDKLNQAIQTFHLGKIYYVCKYPIQCGQIIKYGNRYELCLLVLWL